ncbi:MAG: CocE/NonD family hydrolase [Cyanobacteria bacterium J06598_1]
MLSVQARQTYSMWTRDGVRLDADVYFPGKASDGRGEDSGEFYPVLLMRQPYGRAIASTIVYAHPRWYAAHGYIVVIQDVRGRGSSEGVFDLFAHEVADGEDTVRWAATLPGCDGQVGMYGFSYQGMTQLHAAQTNPPALKTIAPAMTGYHLYEDWATENGALCFQLGLMWALQLAAETARIEGDVTQFQKLAQASRQLPLMDEVPVCPEVLKGVESFFHDWVSCPRTDAYWQQRTPQLQSVDLPMLHIGGWFDPYLRGDLRLYREMSARSEYLHHLWVGPWAHIPWSRKVGAVAFGPAAASPIDRLQIQWFDAILKGRGARELLANQPANLFEMGCNQWRSLPDWSSKLGVTYCLRSEGLSHIREDSGSLVPVSEMPTSDGWVNNDTLVHDPWNPAPALGGHSAVPAGSFERTAVDARGDVLTYTSELLTAELRVVGVPEVVIAIAASSPSYDICAILSRVDSEGDAYNLTQGYRRIDSDPASIETPSPVTVPLHPTCFSLCSGERLRLSLSAACFPAYPINPGTGAPLAQSRLIDAQIITLTVRVGAESGSVLKLPMADD